MHFGNCACSVQCASLFPLPPPPSFSIEYWFRCMDLDGDGVLSLYELVHFYDEVLQRLQELNIDCLSVENTVCQILDMVNPKEQGACCHWVFRHVISL